MRINVSAVGFNDTCEVSCGIIIIIVSKLCKMAEEDVIKPRNFHEMELDDRILKVG